MYGELAQAGFSPLIALQLMGSFSHTGESKDFHRLFPLTLQVTYDSFRNSKQAAKVLATPRLGDSGFEEIFKKQSMGELTELLQPTSLARKRGYKVGASPLPLLQHLRPMPI